MPACLNESGALYLANCIMQGMTPEGCPQFEAAGAFDLPYCDDTPRAPLPECLSKDDVDLIDYCHHGDGSSDFWNGFCWGGMKDPAHWQQYTATPPCSGVAPPSSTALPSGNGKGNGQRVAQGSNALLYGGIAVGAVVVIGGAMWLSRRKG